MSPAEEEGKSQAKERARQLLLDAAIGLLAERGIERVNSNQIARAAGVGVGTFYGHFRDKYELVGALRISALAELGKRLEDVARRPARDRAEQVRLSIGGVLDFAAANPLLFRVVFGHEGASGGGQPQVGYSHHPLARKLRGYQVQGLIASELHPEIAAKAFTSMQVSVVCWWLEDHTRSSREELVETLTRLHPAIAASLR